MERQPVRHWYSPFREIAHDDGAAEPTRTAAKVGLETLQMIELEWDRNTTQRATPADVEAIRHRVQALPIGHPIRAALSALLEALQHSMGRIGRREQKPALARQLVDYGQALKRSDACELAAAVFRTVRLHADPIEERAELLDANCGLAECTRRFQRHAAIVTTTPADSPTSEGAMVPTSGRDGSDRSLQDASARLDRVTSIGQAAFRDGDFFEAQIVLELALADAVAQEREDAAADILLTLARIASEEHDLELATRLAWRAATTSGARLGTREDAMLTLSDWLLECGARRQAADAWAVVYATSPDLNRRARAGIGLMEVAALDHRELLFEHYRQHLQAEALSPVVQSLYWYTVGEGLGAFGHDGPARDALARSAQVAGEHELDVERFRAEEALLNYAERDDDGEPIRRTIAPGIASVMSAVAELRHAVGVASPEDADPIPEGGTRATSARTASNGAKTKGPLDGLIRAITRTAPALRSASMDDDGIADIGGGSGRAGGGPIAVAAVRQAIATATRLENIEDALRDYGRALEATGEWRTVSDWYAALAIAAQQEGATALEGRAELWHGDVERRAGRLSNASTHFDRAARIARDRGDRPLEIAARHGAARVALALGDVDGADETLSQLARYADEHGLTEQLVAIVADSAAVDELRRREGPSA